MQMFAHMCLFVFPQSNPVFSQMNTAYFMYCDAFSFNGQRLEPIAHQGQQLHFQGRAVLDALVDYLVRHHGLGDARRVLLTGHSAGGLAVYFNADYIHARILKSRRSREPLDFRAAPDAGFFLAQKNLLDGAVPDFYHSIQQAATLANASGHDGCVKAVTSSRTGRSQNASQCLLAAHVLPHMRVPVFIVQSLADPWQLVRSVGLSCSPKATLEARDADNSRGRLPCCDSRSMAALQAHTSSIRAALKSLGFMPSASPSASPSSSQPSSSSSSPSLLESSSAPYSARTRSLSVKSSSEYAEAARAGLFAPVCMCHTQMFGHFGHTNGTYNHAAVWAITAPSGERVTPARALLDWWLDRRGLGRGRSGHFHFDDSAWPGNALCARFGVAGFSRLPSGQAFDVT
uniref:Pectin acetylesterase n=1 Tax=Chrysotila carterae TaxID=13221 RepID=A0A6S9SYX5_CHRCT